METGRSPASLAGSPSLSSGFTLDTGALVEREGALEKNVARDRTLPLLRVGWRVPPHVPAIQEVVRLCRLRPYGGAWASLFEVPLLPVPRVEPHCEPPVAPTSRSGSNLVSYLRKAGPTIFRLPRLRRTLTVKFQETRQDGVEGPFCQVREGMVHPGLF